MSVLESLNILGPLGWAMIAIILLLIFWEGYRFFENPDLVGVNRFDATGIIVEKDERPGDPIPASAFIHWNEFDVGPSAPLWLAPDIPGPREYRLLIELTDGRKAWYACSEAEYRCSVLQGAINVRFALGRRTQQLYILQAWH